MGPVVDEAALTAHPGAHPVQCVGTQGDRVSFGDGAGGPRVCAIASWCRPEGTCIRRVRFAALRTGLGEVVRLSRSRRACAGDGGSCVEPSTRSRCSPRHSTSRSRNTDGGCSPDRRRGRCGQRARAVDRGGGVSSPLLCQRALRVGRRLGLCHRQPTRAIAVSRRRLVERLPRLRSIGGPSRCGDRSRPSPRPAYPPELRMSGMVGKESGAGPREHLQIRRPANGTQDRSRQRITSTPRSAAMSADATVATS